MFEKIRNLLGFRTTDYPITSVSNHSLAGTLEAIRNKMGEEWGDADVQVTLHGDGPLKGLATIRMSRWTDTVGQSGSKIVKSFSKYKRYNAKDLDCLTVEFIILDLTEST